MIESRLQSGNHPEVCPGEMFVSNMNSEQFSAFAWSSKRTGAIAFDGEGTQLSFPDWFPVFIRSVELSERGVSLMDLRRSLQERRQAA